MLVVDERGFRTKSFPISTNTFFKFDKYFWTKSSFRKNLWGSWAASLSKNMAGCRCKSATLADFQRWAFPINKSADSQRLEHFLSHRQTNRWRIYRGEKWLLAVEGFEGRIFFNSVPFNWGAKIVAIQAFFVFWKSNTLQVCIECVHMWTVHSGFILRFQLKVFLKLSVKCRSWIAINGIGQLNSPSVGAVHKALKNFFLHNILLFMYFKKLKLRKVCSYPELFSKLFSSSLIIFSDWAGSLMAILNLDGKEALPLEK